jgi:RNA polymerase sigma factor (TIGR02999 family)
MEKSPKVDADKLDQLLARWVSGDKDALSSLFPLVYEELRRLAHHRLALERHDQTLQTTALVHEAYLRLAKRPPRTLNDRKHFFALAATVMRQVLVDHARGHQAGKRDAGVMVEVQPGMISASARELDLLALDRALDDLAKLDARQSKIVELRFFAGMSIEDTSEVLGMSPATVKRDWVTARAWLLNEISKGERRAKQAGNGS